MSQITFVPVAPGAHLSFSLEGERKLHATGGLPSVRWAARASLGTEVSFSGGGKLILPGIGGSTNAEAHIAFHFGAMYVLQILEHVVEHGSAEAAAIALSALTAELDEFMKAHAVAVQ